MSMTLMDSVVGDTKIVVDDSKVPAANVVYTSMKSNVGVCMGTCLLTGTSGNLTLTPQTQEGWVKDNTFTCPVNGWWMMWVCWGHVGPADGTATEGDGLFLEEHPFIQSMTPLNAECGGYVMVGYRDDDGSIHLSGIAIPYGYTLLIDSMALHGDATLVGLYGMEMTADHVEMAKADTVFLKKANGDRLALTEWPTGGGDKVISHPKFTSESSSFFLRRKILNPFF